MDVRIETLKSFLPQWKPAVDILGKRNLSPDPGDFSELPFHTGAVISLNEYRKDQSFLTWFTVLTPMLTVFMPCLDEDVERLVLYYHIKHRSQSLEV